MRNEIMDNTPDIRFQTAFEYGAGATSSIMIVGVHNPNKEAGFFVGSYRGDSFTSILNSFVPENAISLLIRAINNRTVERNYFRLYSQLLEDSISEDRFDEEIEHHEEDYVISTDHKPSQEEVQFILRIADKIKDLNNSTDMATLFSFDMDQTDNLLASAEITDGNV